MTCALLLFWSLVGGVSTPPSPGPGVEAGRTEVRAGAAILANGPTPPGPARCSPDGIGDADIEVEEDLEPGDHDVARASGPPRQASAALAEPRPRVPSWPSLRTPSPWRRC